MKAPALGLSRDANHVYTWWDGTAEPMTFPSVTGVIKVVDKSGPLIGWAKRETAACAVRNLDMLVQMRDTGGPDAAINWLKTIPDYKRDTAADLGTTVHATAEAIARGQTVVVPPEAAEYVAAYRGFLSVRNPEFLAVEEMVVSLRHHYAGTFDAVARIAGETWLLDIKTSTGTYAETALQLAAYARADFIGRPGETRRYRIPKVQRYGVVHVRPEGAQLIPYAVDDETFAAFLRAVGLYGWQQGQARTVVGKALEAA